MGTMNDNQHINTTDIDVNVAGMIVRTAKLLVLLTGGIANSIGVRMKGVTPPLSAVRYLGVDVMPNPPIVVLPYASGTRTVTFTPGEEYVRIGEDMELPKIKADLRARPGRRELLAWLLEGLPASALVQGVESGTKARRRLAYAAFEWSRPMLEHAAERAIRSLNDVRMKDADGNVVENAPINVIVIAGLSGGVGSGTAYPMASLIKETMDRIGISPHRSLFSLFGVGADAFNDAAQRLGNQHDALRDIEVAQSRGVVICRD